MGETYSVETEYHCERCGETSIRGPDRVYYEDDCPGCQELFPGWNVCPMCYVYGPLPCGNCEDSY